MIVEVKTKQSLSQVREAIAKLSDQIEKVRKYNPDCLAGLFVFEEDATNNVTVLEVLRYAASADNARVINWIALGPNMFFRFWASGTQLEGSTPIFEHIWKAYRLEELAHAYFVSNMVWDTSADNDADMQFAWFPIEGGKEPFCKGFARLMIE